MTDADQPAGTDSRAATLLHSLRVGDVMVTMLQEGMRRAVQHDLSKTRPPEVAAFDRQSARLKDLEYGTPAYSNSLVDLGEALEHHYAVNRHHPQHFEQGIDGMTLIDLLEMLADWRAATERMRPGTGDLRTSIAINAQRFGISEQLVNVLLSTAEHFGMIDTPEQV
jgi:uncharacterized protein DUF5662